MSVITYMETYNIIICGNWKKEIQTKQNTHKTKQKQKDNAKSIIERIKLQQQNKK